MDFVDFDDEVCTEQIEDISDTLGALSTIATIAIESAEPSADDAFRGRTLTRATRDVGNDEPKPTTRRPSSLIPFIRKQRDSGRPVANSHRYLKRSKSSLGISTSVDDIVTESAGSPATSPFELSPSGTIAADNKRNLAAEAATLVEVESNVWDDEATPTTSAPQYGEFVPPKIEYRPIIDRGLYDEDLDLYRSQIEDFKQFCHAQPTLSEAYEARLRLTRKAIAAQVAQSNAFVGPKEQLIPPHPISEGHGKALTDWRARNLAMRVITAEERGTALNSLLESLQEDMLKDQLDAEEKYEDAQRRHAQDLSEASAAEKQSRDRLSALQSEYLEVEALVGQLSETAHEDDKTVLEQGKIITRLQDDVEELRSQLEQARQSQAGSIKECTRLSDDLAELKRQLDESRSRLQQAETEYMQWRDNDGHPLADMPSKHVRFSSDMTTAELSSEDDGALSKLKRDHQRLQIQLNSAVWSNKHLREKLRNISPEDSSIITAPTTTSHTALAAKFNYKAHQRSAETQRKLEEAKAKAKAKREEAMREEEKFRFARESYWADRFPGFKPLEGPGWSEQQLWPEVVETM